MSASVIISNLKHNNLKISDDIFLNSWMVSGSRIKSGTTQSPLKKNIERGKLLGVLSYGIACIAFSIIYLEYCETHYLTPILPICEYAGGLKEKYIHVNQSIFMLFLLFSLEFIITAILFSSTYMYMVICSTTCMYILDIGAELW